MFNGDFNAFVARFHVLFFIPISERSLNMEIGIAVSKLLSSHTASSNQTTLTAHQVRVQHIKYVCISYEYHWEVFTWVTEGVQAGGIEKVRKWLLAIAHTPLSSLLCCRSNWKSKLFINFCSDFSAWPVGYWHLRCFVPCPLYVGRYGCGQSALSPSTKGGMNKMNKSTTSTTKSYGSSIWALVVLTRFRPPVSSWIPCRKIQSQVFRNESFLVQICMQVLNTSIHRFHYRRSLGSWRGWRGTAECCSGRQLRLLYCLYFPDVWGCCSMHGSNQLF